MYNPYRTPYGFLLKSLLRILIRGDTLDIAEPTRLPTYIHVLQLTYKTQVQPHTRLSTYIQDLQQTTIQKYDCKLDFTPTYKSLNLSTRI